MNCQVIHVLSSLGESDKELLNEIQWTFPLVTRPFDAIAKKFDTTPEIIKEKLNHLKEIGVLRQLSAIFDTRKLGYTSSLVAMEIDNSKLEQVALIINKHPGVSHNYERKHQFNLWFTLAVPPGSDLKSELDKFSKLDGIKKVRMLPTLQLFKIGVKLDMVETKKHDVKPSEVKKEIKKVDFVATEEDKEFIRQLQKDFDNSIKNLSLSQKDIEIKKFSLDNFINKGFPNRREEDWKFSDLNQIISKCFSYKVFIFSFTFINYIKLIIILHY